MSFTTAPTPNDTVSDLVKSIDTNKDTKVTNTELLAFLNDAQKESVEKDLLIALVSKESELRTIDGLENAIRTLATDQIKPEDLKKKFDVLNPVQKSIILLNEGLYGGKKLVEGVKTTADNSGEKENKKEKNAIDAEKEDKKATKETATPAPETETAKAPELTEALWAKYTLKRTITNVSGMPSDYVANIDDIKVSDDQKSATLTLYATKDGNLVNREIKKNTNNNDSQTTIKFEKKNDGSRGLKGLPEKTTATETLKEQTDSTLIQLSDGTQILRLPNAKDGVTDYKVLLNGGSLQLVKYDPDTSYRDTMSGKNTYGYFGPGIKLSGMRPYVNKEEPDSKSETTTDGKIAYYIADLIEQKSKKSIGQKVLFDQNGVPLPGQQYGIKGSAGTVAYETTTEATEGYVKKLEDKSRKDLNIAKIKESNDYDTTKKYETAESKGDSLKRVDLSPDLVTAGYVIDYVAGEGSYHIMMKNPQTVALESKLTIPKSQVDDIATKSKKLPVYLKDMKGYYKLEKEGNKICLIKDDKMDGKIRRQQQELKDILGTGGGGLKIGSHPVADLTLPDGSVVKNRREDVTIGSKEATYGGLQGGPIISNITPISPTEDMYVNDTGGNGLLFEATVGLPSTTPATDKTVKTATIVMEGDHPQGLPADYKESREFQDSKQVITVQTSDILKTYKVGMKSGHISFQEVDKAATSSAIQEFIKTYKDDKGNPLFADKPFIDLKNTKGDVTGYLVDTTPTGGTETYTAFDLTGNIIPKIPAGSTGKDIDIATVKLDKSYEVKDKNNNIIGLTAQGKSAKEKEQKRKDAPDKIKAAITAGGFMKVRADIEQKNSNGEVIGFISDVKKGKNTYKVYFDLDGNIDSTKPVYELNSDGSPDIAKEMKSAVIGDKLLITKPDVITRATETQKIIEANKELLDGYPKNGIVRIKRETKVYEISADNVKKHAYENLHTDLSKKEVKYQKEMKAIEETYVYKDDTLTSYMKAPFYNELFAKRNSDPVGFNREVIEGIISKAKTTKKATLQPLNDSEKAELQTQVDIFIKDPKNFNNYDVKNATEVKERQQSVEENQTDKDFAVAPTIQNNTTETSAAKNTIPENKKPATLTETQNSTLNTLTTATNKTPVGAKDGLVVHDSHTEWVDQGDKKVSEVFVELEKKNTKITYDTATGTLTTDMPEKYTASVEDGQVMLGKTLPKVEATTGGSNAETGSNSAESQSDSKEQKEKVKLPEFTWASYNESSKPAAMTLSYAGIKYDTSFTDKNIYNKDFSSSFNSLIKLLTTDNARYTEIQKTLLSGFKQKINGISADYREKVKAIQSWSATQGGLNSTDFDKYKLSDGKVGINTYSALLLALYTTPGFADNDTVKNQYESIKSNFTIKTQEAIASANYNATRQQDAYA